MSEKKNGCWNRSPYVEQYVSGYGQVIQNFSFGSDCQYTESQIGQKDAGCNGCKWKKEAAQ